jgi:hypothetical protein
VSGLSECGDWSRSLSGVEPARAHHGGALRTTRNKNPDKIFSQTISTRNKDRTAG